MGEKFQNELPVEQFREAMGHVMESVFVITGTMENGDPDGFTATSVTSLSDSPPSLIFCVNKSNEGAEAYQEGDYVGAFVLAPGQEELANRFAGMHDVSGAEKFEGDVDVDWHMEQDVPVLENVSCGMLGRIDYLYDGYTHHIAVMELEKIKRSDRPPLAYWNRSYLDPSTL